MPTAAERQALVFLAAVALLGGGARAYSAHRFHHALSSRPENANPASTETVEQQLAAVDSARQNRAKSKSGKRPSKQSEPKLVDVDVASAQELEKLPRIGPALAERIVADRDSMGPFGSLEELTRVRGIGPAMAENLSALVTFSGVAIPHETKPATVRPARPSLRNRRTPPTERQKAPAR